MGSRRNIPNCLSAIFEFPVGARSNNCSAARIPNYGEIRELISVAAARATQKRIDSFVSRLGAGRLVHPADRPDQACWSGPAGHPGVARPAGHRLAGRRLGSADYRVHSTCRCSNWFVRLTGSSGGNAGAFLLYAPHNGAHQ